MDKSEIISKLQLVKPYLQQEYAVKSMGLFGSFANDTYSDSSDVDIMVEFEHPIGWQFFKLEKYLETMLQRKIDLVSREALREHIKPLVLSKILYII